MEMSAVNHGMPVRNLLLIIPNEVGNVRTWISRLISRSLQSVMATTERKTKNMNISDTGNEVFMREVEVREHIFFSIHIVLVRAVRGQ